MGQRYISLLLRNNVFVWISSHAVISRSGIGGLVNLSSFYQPRYNNEEQKQILQILNESSAEELSRFDVSKHRIHSLQQFRRKRGQFCTLDQVLEVDGLGIKVLEKLCDSILNQMTLPEEGYPAKEVRKQSRKSTHQFLTPNLQFKQKEGIQTVVGINIGVSAVTWSQIDVNGKLLSWNLHSLESCSKKLHITSLLEVVQDLCQNLPNGDIYVMEDRAVTVQSPQQQPASITVNLQNCQLTAMLVALLNNQSRSEDLHHVFFLRPRLTARLFGALVGTEKVSAQAVVLDILSNTQENSSREELDMESLNKYTPISVTEEMKENYLNRTNVEKETLCWALLLTMAFMDLVLHQNPHSLAVIRGGR
ncbi:transcription elongation factor, mitochondrial isoform X2 [Periplaneta americana]|uniref:transcription elongation factor, mitochondrial isoform X2 n=1 Tax=Periplaneta americana TaxID=6978 RepID=UPI0037E7B10C